MVPSMTRMARHRIFVRFFNFLEIQISHLNGHCCCSSSELCFGDQRRSRRQRRFRGQQMCLRNGSSLSLPRHNYSPPHHRIDRSHSEVSYSLSHTFPQSLKSVLQEELQVLSSMVLDSRSFSRVSGADTRTEEYVDNYATGHSKDHVSVPFRWLHFSLLSPQSSLQKIMPVLNYRTLSGVSKGKTETVEETEQTWDDDDDDDESQEESDESVCKVIEELFTSDRNVEAALDQSAIDLSCDLVLDLLAQFRNAWRPTFWSFCWAGQRPGFLNDSSTYGSMMGIIRKTMQFKSMLAMLEEMRNKRLQTIERLSISVQAFAAAREVKRAIEIFESMRRHNFRVEVGTFICLLNAPGRAMFGKLKISLRKRIDLHQTYRSVQFSPYWMV
ncbi:pentatricopeptide repeat-containing protein At3g62470, mitochondrial-like [Telopea speciosissima]|uniref:pentatricopeptide repeat-containing protein At3g62470, mitochondrial-like n=1 Tax=Telopea speciosissima TaxID=54955 RepID=UPI001CC63945|nr:pentatricopeptide repeat-containing protein At3g62470, mitochondrial-like [Telopea speciosissima]